MPKGAHAGSVQLPETGQTKCYNASGTEIACSDTGQDGDLLRGVAWPSPRFTDNGDGTVLDNLTGLVWLKDANCIKSDNPFQSGVTWQDALDKVADFNANPGSYSCSGYTASHADWRLPNWKELKSLVDYSKYGPALPTGHPFTNVQLSHYCSGSSNYWSYNGTYSNAWLVNMYDGEVVAYSKYTGRYVWPVRSGGSLNSPSLSAPTGLSATASGTTVSLTWSAVSGAAGYKLYYGTTSGSYIGTVDLGNVTSQSFAGVSSGTYYVVITAYDSSLSESAKSTETSVTVVSLSAPTGLSATASGATVSLTWSAVSGAAGYKLYYGTTSGSYIGTVDLGNVTSQSFAEVSSGTYYVVLRCYAGLDESLPSEEVTVTVNAP